MSVQLQIKREGAHFRFVSELGGVSYSFELRWNHREAAWFLTLGDGEGLPIVAGIRVVTAYSLLSRFTDERLPPGLLFAIDTAGGDVDPGLDDLGHRVQIVYFEPGEVA